MLKRAGKMMSVVTVVGLAVILCLGSGCQKKQVKTDEGALQAADKDRSWDREPSDAKVPRPRLGAEESLESSGRGELTRKAGAISEGRTSGPMMPVFFDYDSNAIKGEQKNRIEGNGHFLKTSPRIRIRIEGNCDERGTEEYNLALGERRARSAKKFLVNYGIDESRMTTLSLGEEKPLQADRDEQTYALNRRADFVIVE